MTIKQSPKSWNDVEVPQLQKTIEAQAAEIAKLRALLRAWIEISPSVGWELCLNNEMGVLESITELQKKTETVL